MVKVKMVLALVNKEGWSPTGEVDGITYDGRPMSNYVNEAFPVRVRVVGDVDFQDKFLVYQHSLDEYDELYKHDEFYRHKKWVDFSYKHVSAGEFRGVVVVAWYIIKLIGFGREKAVTL